MFPITTNTDAQQQAEAVQPLAVEDIGRSIKFDYEKNKFIFENGQAQEIKQTEAVKQWLELMCRTLPDKFKVYNDTGFGIQSNLIRSYKVLPVGFVYSEIKRQIEENSQLTRCIKSIINFKAENNNGILNIYFTAVLTNGNEVDINV